MDTLSTAAVLQHYMDLRGVSPAQLGQRVGVSGRQIGRYIDKSEPQQPTLQVARRIADELDISLLELAGVTPTDPNLSGTWSAFHAVGTRVESTSVLITQDGNYMRMCAPEDADYAREAELRLDRQTSTIVGEWRSNNGAVLARGGYFFNVHPQGRILRGSWFGLDGDALETSGRVVLGRDADEAEERFNEVQGKQGDITSWTQD